jgi:hypothetical protein
MTWSLKWNYQNDPTSEDLKGSWSDEYVKKIAEDINNAPMTQVISLELIEEFLPDPIRAAMNRNLKE